MAKSRFYGIFKYKSVLNLYIKIKTNFLWNELFFTGNSTSAILDGAAVLTMLPRGEDYVMTIPYAHCKGIVVGTLSMELGGKVNITCEKTGYHTELEFKLKVPLEELSINNFYF